MKNKLLFALAFLGLSTTAFAQFSDSTETQNHLGIIAKPRLEKIFTANQSLPVGLIYKRQVKSDQALRFSAIGFYNRTVSDFGNNNYGEFFDETTESSWQTMIGYEWQKPLSKRWNFYYGAELGISSYKISKKTKFSNFQNNLPLNQVILYPNHTNHNSVNYLLQHFAGFRLNLHTKLYLATETTIAFRYSKNRDEHNEFTVSNDGTNGKTEKIRTNTFENYNLRYFPLSNIQLVYKF
ncbi:hypothetical protein [Adhaeribacter terreus]|uniref:DUF481 domain-containing protein n=1 Tax=Adhaeribacter terreus TaxID=529703 RepID=A0ABW0EAL1_9BACT